MTLDGRQALYLSRLAWSDCLDTSGERGAYRIMSALAYESEMAEELSRASQLLATDAEALALFADRLELESTTRCGAPTPHGRVKTCPKPAPIHPVRHDVPRCTRHQW